MDEQPPPLDLQTLKAISVLGRGAKGVAFLVKNQASSNETLALKTISKTSIEKKKSDDAYKRIWFERDVLNTFRHPLLPKLRGFIVTEKIVGFAIEHCSGGDLNSLRRKQTENMFSDEIIRFYAAELVLALEYLHGLGIVYRDLKPENILIQDNGHLMLIDFDLSTKLAVKSPETRRRPIQRHENRNEPTKSEKKRRFPLLFSCLSRSDSVAPAESRVDSVSAESDSVSCKSNSFVGTEDYVPPEIILGNGHDFAVDWWSLGVVLYEMLYGRTPFRGTNRKETFYRILTKSPELVGERTALRDLIRKLLEKEPGKRISGEGIKGHEFFRRVDWESVVRISRPPYIPNSRGEEVKEEDMEGIKGIDVEEFVRVVFNNDEVGKEKLEEINNNNINNDDDNKDNKGVWEEGLNNACKSSDFLIF